MAIKKKFPYKAALVACNGGCHANGDEVCSYGCIACGACVEACKFNAVSINEDGVAEINEEKCIGCKMCVMACPFGNIAFSRTAKAARKCDQCGGEPMCAEFCPTKAIEYLPADTANLNRKKAFSAKMKKAIEEVK